MPVYADKRKVAVSVGAQYGGLYGFQTNIDTADSSALGHQAVTGNTATPVFFGCSRPKPARVRKVSQTESVSSFLSASVDLASLPTWVLASAAKLGPAPRETAKSTLHYVTIQGAKYAWNAPKYNTTKVPGDLINVVTGSDYCFKGANYIEGIDDIEGGRLNKPPRVCSETAGQDGVDIVSTFTSWPIPATLPAGWVPKQ